jgi:hypothetical protein
MRIAAWARSVLVIDTYSATKRQGVAETAKPTVRGSDATSPCVRLVIRSYVR